MAKKDDKGSGREEAKELAIKLTTLQTRIGRLQKQLSELRRDADECLAAARELAGEVRVSEMPVEPSPESPYAVGTPQIALKRPGKGPRREGDDAAVEAEDNDQTTDQAETSTPTGRQRRIGVRSLPARVPQPEVVADVCQRYRKFHQFVDGIAQKGKTPVSNSNIDPAFKDTLVKVNLRRQQAFKRQHETHERFAQARYGDLIRREETLRAPEEYWRDDAIRTYVPCRTTVFINEVLKPLVEDARKAGRDVYWEVVDAAARCMGLERLPIETGRTVYDAEYHTTSDTVALAEDYVISTVREPGWRDTIEDRILERAVVDILPRSQAEPEEADEPEEPEAVPAEEVEPEKEFEEQEFEPTPEEEPEEEPEEKAKPERKATPTLKSRLVPQDPPPTPPAGTGKTREEKQEKEDEETVPVAQLTGGAREDAAAIAAAAKTEAEADKPQTPADLIKRVRNYLFGLRMAILHLNNNGTVGKGSTPLHPAVGALLTERSDALLKSFLQLSREQKEEALAPDERMELIRSFRTERFLSEFLDPVEQEIRDTGLDSHKTLLGHLALEMDIGHINVRPGRTRYDTKLHICPDISSGESNRRVITREVKAGYTDLSSGEVLRKAVVKTKAATLEDEIY